MIYGVLMILAAVLGVVLGAGLILFWSPAKRNALFNTKSQKKLMAELANEAGLIEVAKRQIETAQQQLQRERDEIESAKAKVRAAIVNYDELLNENGILKRDLLNLSIEARKLRLDHEQQAARQGDLDERAVELGRRYLKDAEKWIGSRLNANNYAKCKQDLVNIIERCREAGCPINAQEEESLIDSLKEDFEKAVRASLEREEQSRIKAQIREEQLREREIERELAQLERERAAVQAALDRALADAQGRHTEEVAGLQSRLAEAEAAKQRTKAQAELTKSGHIYVISNVGAFGENVYKIGMTRRLEPHDRIRELGDASVPFHFDVHMMISCDNAPALENALHKALHKHRLNRVNLRKEFFRVDIESIRKIAESHHGEVRYVADAEALEYRQSVSMPEEDAEFIEDVYDRLEDDGLDAEEV